MGATPTSATGFFQMFQDKNDTAWSSGDQVTSFQHNGFNYWLFGDTILGTENPDGTFGPGAVMIGNRILMQSGDQLSNAMSVDDGNPAVPNPATRTSANNERYWLQGMFAANEHIYVLCQRVMASGSGFKLVGGELAKFKQDPNTGKLSLYGMFVTPATGQLEVQSTVGIQWCSDAIVDGGYVYIYGATRAGSNPYVTHWSYVARVPVGSVENPFEWRFYKKTTGEWVNSIAQLSQDAVNQPDGIVASQISSVRKVGNVWVMVHKPWNGLGVAVRAMTSPMPYGPWTPPASDGIVIFESPAGSNYITYSPQLHPEFPLTSGKTLVSIAWNGKTLSDTMNDADLYKPRFYEIQF